MSLKIICSDLNLSDRLKLSDQKFSTQSSLKRSMGTLSMEPCWSIYVRATWKLSTKDTFPMSKAPGSMSVGAKA